jgi:hypothetical protein
MQMLRSALFTMSSIGNETDMAGLADDVCSHLRLHYLLFETRR